MSRGEEKIEPSQYLEQAKGYYQNYSRWVGDATKNYESKAARFRATSGAAGVQAGDTKVVDDKYKKDYDERMNGINSGVHGTFLNDYFNQTKQTLIKQIGIDNKIEAEKQAEAKARAENPFYSSSGMPKPLPSRARSKYGGEQFFTNLGGIEEIQNLTMEGFYSSKFGKQEQGRSKEKEAILNASNFGGRNARRTAASKQQNEDNKLGNQSWWG